MPKMGVSVDACAKAVNLSFDNPEIANQGRLAIGDEHRPAGRAQLGKLSDMLSAENAAVCDGLALNLQIEHAPDGVSIVPHPAPKPASRGAKTP